MSVELPDVKDAAARLRGVARQTPVMTSRTLNDRVGAEVFLKCETFQRTGSFKFRGAYNLISSLGPAEQARGVCAISSGNHAQAVASSARELGLRAAILMPEDAPAAKADATRGYGAEIVRYDRYSIPQAEAGRRFQAERGMTFVPAYDDPRIVAGAGTAALELLGEVGPLDLLVTPVGGGGLLSGTATTARALNPGCQVLGVESVMSGVHQKSLAAGERVTIDVPRTIADGQALTTPGELTFAIIRRLVDAVSVVEEPAILRAMGFLFDRLKLVTEPSGAIGVAALLSGAVKPDGRRTGVVLSGGNVGVDRFLRLLGEAE